MDTLLDSPSPFVSIGGLAIGLGILVYYVLPWWLAGRKSKGGKGKKGGDAPVESGRKRNWRDLAPLAVGLTFGSLAAACAGGALGWAAYGVSRTNESVGNTAVMGTTGTGGDGVEQGTLPGLVGGAAILTALFLVGLVAVWKKLPKATKQQIIAGSWAGVSLALSAGATGMYARTVVPLFNSIGDSLGGAL